jgi:hypothetical protein
MPPLYDVTRDKKNNLSCVKPTRKKCCEKKGHQALYWRIHSNAANPHFFIVRLIIVKKNFTANQNFVTENTISSPLAIKRDFRTKKCLRLSL